MKIQYQFNVKILQLKKVLINDIIIIGEYMNNYEVYYKDSLYIIDVIGQKNVLNSNLNNLNVTIKNKDYSFDLGNFYTELPELINDQYMFNFIKNLINNIDDTIFRLNRYIGSDSAVIDELNKKSKVELELEKIYSEFLSIKKNTKDYAKYCRFLELYFYGHNIPDGVRYLYLKRRNKSILDFKNVDDNIKCSFSYNISDLKDESEYKNNLILLEKLSSDLNEKEKEIGILNEIVSHVENVINKHKENNAININIEDLECKLKSLSFFDKNRNSIKNKLRNLKESIIEIDILNEREKIYDEYNNYASVYGDKHGVLLLFDKLDFSDILSLLKGVLISKNNTYLGLLDKINNLNKQIENYDDNTVDISDLYERLEVE